MKPKTTLRNFLCIASSALFTFSYAQAAPFTWTKLANGTAASGNWSTATNWSAVPVSAADTTLVFGYSFGSNSTAETNTLTNDVANPFSLNVLTLGINTPAAGNGSQIALINIAGSLGSSLNFVLNGATTPQVNLNQNRSNGQVVSFNVQSNVTLGANTLFTGNGTANFTISGIISGAGTFTKSGTSTLALSGANDYSSGTSISGGILSIGSAGTLGQNVNTNNVSLAAGARLDLTAAGNTGANQTITLTSTAGSLATLALGYNGVPNATIAQADTNGGVIAINAVTGYTGNLSTALTGKNLFLGGTGTSTFTGAVGTVVAGNDSTFRLGGGGGSISFNTANLITGANSVQIGSTATGGTGTAIFGAAQDYTLGTTISAGSTLRFDILTSMPATGDVSVATGATLGVTVASTATTWGGGASNAGIAGLTSTANGGKGYGGQTGSTVTFAGNSSLLLNVTADTTESNAITNGGATNLTLIKSGANALTLSGENTHSGGTTLSAGTLNINNGGSSSSNSAIGTGTFTISGGTINNTSGAASSTVTLATNNALALNGDFTYTGTNSRNLNLGTGAVTMGATRTVTISAGNLTIGGNIASTSAGITKAGVGTLTLSGTNSHSGGTTNNTAAGRVIFNGAAALGSGGTTGALLVNAAVSSTFEIRSDVSYNRDIGIRAFSAGTMNLVFDTQTGISSSGLNYQFSNGNNGMYDISGGSTVNFSAGTIMTSGTPTVQIGQIRSQGGTSSAAAVINASGVNLNIGTLTATGPGADFWTLGGTSTGNVVTGAISHSVIKQGAGTWTLSSTSNAYTGSTTISSGALKLGANNVLPNASNVSIGTGTLDADTRTDTAGTLNATGTATINLGTGAALAFANSSGVTGGVWAGALNITGTFVPGNGVDPGVGVNPGSLRFGVNNTGLTASQLADITVNGSGTYALDAFGYLIAGGGASAYDTWKATNAPSGNPSDDFDLDGVSNIVEFMLDGLATTNDLGKLPVVSQVGGNLELSFTCLNVANRGGALLKLQYSKDLGITDLWSSHEVTVPDTAGVVGSVTFSIPSVNANPNLVNLKATIPASEAAPGTKLFGRLMAQP